MKPQQHGNLITCKDCGKEVSKKADKCPNCGAPLKKSLSRITWYLLGIIVLGFIGLVLIIPFWGKGSYKIGDVTKRAEKTAPEESEKVKPKESLPENIYLKWVDGKGDVHYTQEMEAIPKEYRSKVEKVDLHQEKFGEKDHKEIQRIKDLEARKEVQERVKTVLQRMFPEIGPWHWPPGGGDTSLWVKVPAYYANDKYSCKELAEKIARAGRIEKGSFICVHLYYGNLNEIAKACE